MNLIKLKDRSGQEIYINVDRIVCFRKYKDGTTEVQFDNNLWQYITEPVDEFATRLFSLPKSCGCN